MKYLALCAVAFGCAGFALLVHAGSFNLPAHGGSGGNSFSLDCGDDKVLIGVRGRKGDWLDRLQAVCTKISTPNNVVVNWVGDLSTTQTVGGGGDSFAVNCPRNMAVKGISGRFGSYVNRLVLRCRPLGVAPFPGQFPNLNVSGSQSGDQSFNVEFCPNGKPARGFHGRTGGYVDRAGLICHTGTTPQVLAPPSELVAVNLITPQGPTTTAITPFVQIQWTDQSTIEGGFRVFIVGTVGETLDRPNAAGVGLRQALTITDLPSGEYSARVCARFNEADGGDQCTLNAAFRIARAATCSPVITSAERIGAGTGRVRWSHGCNNPTSFVVRLRCGNSPFGTVATTADGTAREETFNFGVGGGALQVCASYPGQPATGFCSTQIPFQCN
jgi:hypothetical protein